MYVDVNIHCGDVGGGIGCQSKYVCAESDEKILLLQSYIDHSYHFPLQRMDLTLGHSHDPTS